MATIKHLIKGSLALVSVVIMTSGAYAWPAMTTNALNVRSGPSTNFRVIEALARGTQVDIAECRNGWCKIGLDRGRTGWVSARYLNEEAAPTTRPVPLQNRPQIQPTSPSTPNITARPIPLPFPMPTVVNQTKK